MKDINLIKKMHRQRRHRRVRSKITGTNKMPRLSVYRSLKHVYAQLVDDLSGKTLVSASDLDMEKKGAKTAAKAGKKTDGKKIDLAATVGTLLAKKATEKGITKVVFDRGHYKYHGRIKALADAARNGGLKF